MKEEDAQQIIESDDDEENEPYFESVQRGRDAPSVSARAPDEAVDYSRFEIQSHLRGFDVLTRPWRVSLALSGVVGVALSFTVVACGVATLALASRPYREQQHFFGIADFGAIALSAAGVEAIRKSRRDRTDFGSWTILSIFAALSIVASVCNVATLAVDMSFGEYEGDLILEILALIYSLVCFMISLCQVVIAVKAGSACRYFDNRAAVDNRDRRSTILLGTVELVSGLAIACLMVKCDSVRRNVGSAFTSEYQNVGWLIAVSGTFLILPVFSSTDRRSWYVALITQAFALLAVAKFAVTPLTSVYVLGRDESDKLYWSLFLSSLFTIPVCLLGFFRSLKRSVDFNDNDRDRSIIVEQIGNVMGKRWPLYAYIPSLQLVLGLLYILLFVVGAVEGYLYVTDFTPLPLMLLVHAALSYHLRRCRDPWSLTANFAWITVTVMYALRDVYLFDYHAAVANSPDAPSLYANSTSDGAKIGVHVATAAVALMALLAGMAATAVYLRTLVDSAVFVVDRMFTKRSMRVSKVATGCQLVCGAVMTNLGFATFLSKAIASQMLGDHTAYIGLLVVFSSILTLVAINRSPTLLPLAYAAQILTCFVAWQSVDYCSELLWQVLAHTGEFFPDIFVNLKIAFLSSRNLATMGSVGLALLVVQLLCGCLNILLLNGAVENGAFRPKPTNIEMASLG